ncbi:MAG TPA: phosphoribosylformylglycinamidine cyclo-ligase [Deltaproteobacteria bacterium]|nr:phosphoribosylformylglycinamidine cyclo-ligase [Deltaproteobacteria bacterium]
MNNKKLSYRDAGVDIDEANSFVESIKPLIRSTTRKGVVGGIGGFGGLFHLDREHYSNPLLVSTTDGVGTKLMIAREMNRHDTVGIDLVAMNVNDLVVQGAEPLFFLDYIATGKIRRETLVSVVKGIARGCAEAGCALTGGETAEMPGFYGNEEYDLAGFAVGVVEYDNIIDGSAVRAGDVIIGLASSGLHSNGFSLARKVLLEEGPEALAEHPKELEGSIGDELLTPTRIYVQSVLALIKNVAVNGIAHITGGGFYDNIPRVLHPSLRADINRESWPRQPIFDLIQQRGTIEDSEMYRVFNMGIGMILLVHREDVEEALDRLRSVGESAFVIGSIAKKKGNDEASVVIR